MRRLLFTGLALVLAGNACTSDQPVAVSADDAASLARIAGADQGGKPVDLVLTGAQERPVPVNTPATGTMRLTLNVGQQTICYDLSVMDLTSTPRVVAGTAAHIHQITNFQTGTGGIVVPLPIPLQQSFTTQHCVGDVSRDLLRRILQDPQLFYVNVHTMNYPAGEIRGDF